jgi:predicted ester cyclase
MWRKNWGSYVLLFAVLLAATLGMAGCQPVRPVSAMPASETVSAEQAVVGRFYEEVVNQKHMEVLQEVFDPKMVGHELEQVVPVVKDTDLFAAFPDLHIKADRWAIDGDLVTALVTVSGTHTGADLAGVPASGKPVTWSQVDLWRIQDGKIAEVWHNFATADILQQIGYTFVPPAQ